MKQFKESWFMNFMDYTRREQYVIARLLQEYNSLFCCYAYVGKMSEFARACYSDESNMIHLLHKMKSKGIIELERKMNGKYVIALTYETIEHITGE